MKVLTRETRGRKPIPSSGIFGQIGARIREHRGRLGMSVQQAADATGGVVNARSWYEIERGETRTGLFKFIAVALALGVPAYKLLGDELGRVVAKIRGPVQPQEIARLLHVEDDTQ